MSDTDTDTTNNLYLQQTQKDLDEILRFRPKIAQQLLGMIKQDYELFGLEPSLKL